MADKGEQQEGAKEEDDFRLSDYLMYYLAHIVNESHRKIEEVMKPYGIKFPAWRIILLLHEGKSLSVSEISKEVLLDKSRVSRVAVEMEKEGIVQRAKCGDDQRFTRLELTEKGYQIYRKFVPVVERQLESTLSGISDKDREHLYRMVKAMKKNVYRSPYADIESL